MNRNEPSTIPRRDVLKTIGLGAGLGVVGTGVLSAPVRASAASGCAPVYLLETDENTSELYSVSLEDGEAVVEMLPNGDLPADNYKASAALAATPDGSELYVVDRDSNRLGVYDFAASSFEDLGVLSNAPGATVQFAFAPDGTLYAGSNDTNKIYTIDLGTLSFVEAFDPGISLNGADIAFDAAGTLYITTNSGNDIYAVDLNTETVTEFGSIGSSTTGLAIGASGTGDLLASLTKDTRLAIIDGETGSSNGYLDLVDGSGNTYNHTYGDLTTGPLAPVIPLCAGQDIDVGSVTVLQNGDGSLSITYEVDEPWLLYETHLHVAGDPGGFPTNNGGNPKIGQFEYSQPHDGVSSYTYTVPASEVPSGVIYIATHAVVKAIRDGCVDFTAFEPGASVDAPDAVVDGLTISALGGGGNVVALHEDTEPATYGAPNGSGSVLNGCLGELGGFGDLAAKEAGTGQDLRFEFEGGARVTEFSLRMLDYGDFNPDHETDHEVEMTAYDAEGNKLDSQRLAFTSDNGVNPSSWTPVEGTTLTNASLYQAGDACDAADGEPGNYLWSMTSEEGGIARVELVFGSGVDPNIAFGELCFTAEDETAWTCEGTQFTDQGSWATYFQYTPCE